MRRWWTSWRTGLPCATLLNLTISVEVGWLYQLKFHITLKSQENVLVKKPQFSVLTFAGGSLEEAGACLAEKEEDKSTSSSSS